MGQLNQCLRISDAFATLTGNNSFLKPLDAFFERFCDSTKTPLCEEENLQEVLDLVNDACGESLGTVGSLHGVVRMITQHYPKMRQAMCSKNPV